MFAQVVTTFQALDASAWYVPRVLTGIIFVLLQWRFWSFTVKPALNPKHPKEIPYCEFALRFSAVHCNHTDASLQGYLGSAMPLLSFQTDRTYSGEVGFTLVTHASPFSSLWVDSDSMYSRLRTT